MDISPHQRRVLVEHTIESGDVLRPEAEARFADVVADLSMGRPVVDRDLFVEFLWHRLTIAVDAGPSRRAQWVWSAAVQLLDALHEDLEAIFHGRR